MNRSKPRSELPEKEPNIYGREKEIDNIVQALSGKRKETVAGVLVSGTAGVGKSTVAIEAGHRLKNDFEAVVKFCSLGGAYRVDGNEDDGVLREILDVCVPGHQQGSDYPRHVLLNWCRSLDYEMILILDNVEDVTDGDHEYYFLNLLRDMRMRSDYKLKFLLTSSSDIETVGTVSNIHLHKVCLDTLDVKESIKVLKNGAHLTSDANPDTEVKLRKIAELCGNIPLALKLAGPLLTDESEYTFEDLKQKLEQNPARTLGIKRIVEIAFKKLDKSLQRALINLSVFPQSFKRDAAEAILGDNCPEDLTNLKKRCLIQKQGGRYQIHLLIRGYAKQIGESFEFGQILSDSKQHYLRHFLTLILRNAQKYWGKDTCKESLRLFDQERTNLEFTLRKIAAGQNEVQNCKELEDVVDACCQLAPYVQDCVSSKLYSDFLNGLLHFSESQNNVTKQVEILCLLYDESRRHGGDVTKASEGLIGRAIKLHGSPCFDRHSLSEVFYLSHYGRYLSQDLKRRKEAQPYLQEAISMLQKSENASQVPVFDKGRILGQLGHNAKRSKREKKKRYQEALHYYEKALHFRQQNYGKHVVTALSRKDLADYYLATSELGKAEENYEAAVQMFQDMEMTKQKEISQTYKNFGRCYEKMGKNDRARQIFEMGSEIAEKTIEGNHKWKVRINTYLALLLYSFKEHDKADELSKNVFQMANELDMNRWPDSDQLKKFFERKKAHSSLVAVSCDVPNRDSQPFSFEETKELGWATH